MIKDINKMKVNELIPYIRKESKTNLITLINDKERILQLDINRLSILFLNVDDDLKIKLLEDVDLFDKVMSIPLNRMKKSIIDLSSDKVIEYICNSKNLKRSISGKKLLEIYLKKLSIENFTPLLDNDNLKEVYKIDVIGYLNNNFEIDPYLKIILLNSINNQEFNSMALFKIKNEVELLIYAKFGLLVDTVIKDKQIFINDSRIDFNFIRNVNRKHIVSLIQLFQKKEANIKNNVLFTSVIKMYMIFGLDNSKKIINDFFTFATPASITRVSNELFKEARREFRLNHQKKFYYHNMETDFLKALYEDDLSFFKNFCLDTSDDYIKNLIATTKQELLYLSELEKLKKIKEIIDIEINKREWHYQRVDTDKYFKYYQEKSRKSRLACQEIYEILKDTEVKYNLSKDGKIIINDELNQFLLGNYKKDNNCLLRMIFNEHAFGLNREIYNIINHFEEVQEIIERNSNLSLNSISDVIDISKTFLYHLKPNELDITLETLSKILNSRKYCTESPEIILDKTLKLHVERKKKVACAIEYIEGSYNEVQYRLAGFDSEDLLVSGIDTGSCFKIGGKGEDFFRFCLTNPKGLVFYIEYANTKYVLPCTINGNMLNINSIDPVIEDSRVFHEIIGAIKQMSKEIIDNKNNKIELVTLCDIHLNKFLDNSNYEIINFEKFIPLNTDVYCDYNKKDVTNYVLCKKDDKVKDEYFDNNDLFYQKRSMPYIFSPSHEYDKERLYIRINSIAYSYIDYLNISSKEKQKEKEYYLDKNIDDYIYIVGNKDWFIGIRKDKGIDRYILPYDKRALDEFNTHSSLIEDSLMDINVTTQTCTQNVRKR